MKNKHAAALGKKGGMAGRGKAKARTSEQAKAAAKARWSRWQEMQDELETLRRNAARDAETIEMLGDRLERIEKLVTTDHETKAEFIHRVRMVLSA